MGIILNLYLKTGIFVCLEGRMMLTIINVTKTFTRGGEIKSSISFVSIRSTYRQHSKKGTRGSQFWEPESLQSNKIWEAMIHIKLVNLLFTTNEICERFGHCIEKFRKLSCCLTQISRVCVCLCPFSKYV